MRKSELEDMVDNLKRQVTQLERDGMKLYRLIEAMAECLNIVCVPPETSELKYKKKGRTE